MKARHTNSVEICPLCNIKLLHVHPELRSWFWNVVKKKFPESHISWGYRDQKSQDEAFKQGLSKLKFPNSPHNKEPSLAIDIFLLNKDGKAEFPPRFYVEIAKLKQDNMVWGGNFAKLADLNHYQIKNVQIQPIQKPVIG